MLAGQDEDAAQAGALGRSDVGADVVADHRDVGTGEVATDLSAKVGDRHGEELRMGLADDAGAGLGRELEAGDERTRVERRAFRRQPPGVLVHADEDGAVADEPEGAVHVVERHFLG